MSSSVQLQQRVQNQLSRLLRQLQDLEDSKSELEVEEYEETRNETLAQMKEFEESLEKLEVGNLTLENEYTHLRLAMQATVSQAFKTPEIIGLFAKKQPQQLRSHLEQLDRDLLLGKVKQDDYDERKIEVLLALEKLKEKLTNQERQFLQEHGSKQLILLRNVD